MQKKYPSKLMLFGEYAVIAGGEGLAVPYPAYTAMWMINTESVSTYKPHLIKFCNWLFENGFETQLNVNSFSYDLQHGLDLVSNVPIGYGVGSSGVVVAAVFDKYAIQIPDTLATLKMELAAMENYFHATSSGLDPLVCYLNKAIHVHPQGINIIESNFELKKLKLNLIDCGASRSTQQMVTAFNNCMLNANFADTIQQYIQISNDCIASWLAADEDGLIMQLQKLSALQYNNFEFAIPAHMRERWHAGLTSGKEFIKLCGAGGGGFLIAFEVQ